MSSVRVLGWWCHLSWVDNIAKWFELPCAFICNFLSAITRCAKFYEILSKLFQFWQKVFCPQPSIRPLFSVGKVALTVENWNGSWLQNNGGDFSLSKTSYFSLSKTSYFSLSKTSYLRKCLRFRRLRLQVFRVGRYRSQSCCLPPDHNFATATSHGGGKEGGRGGVKQGGKGRIVVAKGGLVRYVDLNGGKTRGLGNCLHWSEVWRLWELLAYESFKTKLWERKMFNPCVEILFLSFGGNFGKRVLLMLKWKC